MSRLFSNSSKNTISDPRSLIPVLACLRIVIVLQCIGIAGRYLFSQNESESDVYGYLFFDLGWSEVFAQSIDDAGAWGCLIGGMILLAGLVLAIFGPSSKRLTGVLPAARIIESVALIFLTTWVLMMAATHLMRGDVYAELSFGEYAARFVAPAGLLMLIWGMKLSSQKLIAFTIWLLLIGAAATFVVHGYKALELHGPFIDLILLSDMQYFHLELAQSTTERWLMIIGWLDIAVAIILIATRWPIAALYMVVWGLITALSRMTAFGQMGWPETVIRSANWGVPLAILMLPGRASTSVVVKNGRAKEQ